MVISQLAIDNFLERPAENWDWLKEVSREDLLEEINNIIEGYEFKGFTPFNHQLVCLLLGLNDPNFLFLLQMGLGKSLCCIMIMDCLRRLGQFEKGLILVPNLVMIDSWIEQLETFSDFTYTGLVGTKKERLNLIEEDTDIFIINYQGLQSFLAEKGDNKRKPAYRDIVEFAQKFNVVIYDESYALQSTKSLTYKICKKLSENIENRYCLTGTPVGKNAMSIFGQYYCTDLGETLGQTLSLFRESFFKEKVNYWGGYEYKLRKDRKDVLFNKIKNRSIRYKQEECLDLPPKVYIDVPVSFPESIKQHYDQALRGFVESQNDYITIKNKFIELRMIVSGFVSFKNDEDERIKIILDDNPKLDVLIELIKETPENSKVVIFNEFIISGDLISKRLKKEKIKHARLYGGTKDKAGELNKFLKDKSCKAFVLNTQSGAMGLNLQCANYIFFYESPVSNVIRAQAEKRCHRIGSTETVFIYDIFIKNSIEEKVLSYVQKGKDLLKALIDKKEVEVLYQLHLQ